MGAHNSKHSTEAVCAERRRFLSMSPDNRRRHYYCRTSYTSVMNVADWLTYHKHVLRSPGPQSSQHPVDEALNAKICLYAGDITRLEIDAIVNSACDPYRGKGAVNRALFERGGEFYQSECIMKGLPEPGQAKVTAGYKIPSRYVIHTVPPKTRQTEVLIRCYQNCLETAKGHGIRTVAFPCLATNKIMGFNKEKAAHIALSTARCWLAENKAHIDRLVFCVFTEKDEQAYQNLLQIYFPVQAENIDILSNNDTETELQDLILAHHMIRMITGARPAQPTDATEGATASTAQPLKKWQEDNTHPLFQPIRLDRQADVPAIKLIHVLYNSPEMDYRRRPLMQFSGEEGLDLGALTREFFYKNIEALTQKQIASSPAFEGSEDHRLPCASRIHLRNGVYDLTGKVVSHSVLHDGAGLHGLSPALVFLLTHRVDKAHVEMSGIPLDIDDIADADMQTMLKMTDQIKSMSASDRQGLEQDLRDAMERCNYGTSPINSTTLPAIKQEIVLYEVIFKRWDQIEQIRRGLEVLGLYSFLCDNPSQANIARVFPAAADVRIVPELITAKLTPKDSISKYRGYFTRILDDIHSGELGPSLADLVTFWTGHPLLPEGDLHVVVDDEGKYPVANCCFLKLELPGATKDYTEFREAFRVALSSTGATGFMRA